VVRFLGYWVGHEEEIFSIAFNYESDTIITGSKDNTCIIWRDQKKMNDIV
jgi:WD40 repeat protein